MSKIKTPLTYYGGKQKLSKLINSLIPEHTLFCEPFAGGGAIFWTKSPSPVEVINDSNGEIINFYTVLKTRFSELESEIQATLHSRLQYSKAVAIYQNAELFNDVKRAWALWVLANQSYAGKLNGQWGYDRAENKSARSITQKKNAFTEQLAMRLEHTQIECADALQVIKSRDSKDSFFYCDPPYFNSHKGHYKDYNQEDFERLLTLLSDIKGKFLLSSYPSDVLKKHTAKHKWFTQKIDIALSLSSSPSVKKKRKTEVLTANYPI